MSVTDKVTERERAHNDVYGKSFALYGADEMAEFVDFFRQRFDANGLDAKALFGGKACVDAGCGNGRGAMFMLMNGARHVTCLDISPINLESTRRNLTRAGFSNFETHLVTLEDLPFADGSFDFVWCNGVLMHTDNPDNCLRELTRVMKIGGKSWIYVYAMGGFYWHLMYVFRDWFRNLPSEVVLEFLQAMRLPVRYIAEYMDNWKVSNLRTYSDRDFATRLKQVGHDIQWLRRGVSYDPPERLARFPQDKPWLGDGELRYILTKVADLPSPEGQPLSNDQWGSKPDYDPAIEANFGVLLRDLTKAVSGNMAMGIVAASHVQRHLRDMMTEDAPFDVAKFQGILTDTIALIRRM
jgi:ubiquinone/menaquinone biosynthesis C-methylase UbiE